MARDPDRRQTIITGASKLFLLHGYDAVTVDKICSQTDSAKGSFYHFFHSKEDLAIQVVDTIWHETQRRMEETFSNDKTPLESIREELVLTYTKANTMQGRSRHFTGSPIGTLSVSMAGRSEKIRKRINFAFTHMRHFYLTAFTEALDNGDINSPLDANQLADLLLVTIQGISIIGRSNNSPARVRKLVANIMSTFIGDQAPGS